MNTELTAIIKRKRYSTATATRVAGFEGRGPGRGPGNPKALYRTPNGSYFLVIAGRADYIMPIEQQEALDIWEDQDIWEPSDHLTDFETAFPQIPIMDA